MRMTAFEKSFVNSPGHAAEVAGRAERLLAEIPVEPGWRYLDVGCGVGSGPRRIAETYDLEVVGVDIDPAQIEAARAGGSRPNLRFEVMDATALDFPGASFDVVATSMTTHHIPGFERALDEMARVVRPGGYIIYTDLSLPRWAAAVGRSVAGGFGYPTETALRAFAERNGLQTIRHERRWVQADWIWRKR